MNRFLSLGGAALISTLLLVGCAEQETDSDPMVETEIGTQSATTNVQDDATATAPGTGSAVGGDPSGAGTKPLRDENQP